MIQEKLFSNGLRLYMDHVEHVESVLVAVMVKCGSSSESEANNGVAHFLEHMIFKGTEKRSAKEISEIIENVGGEINAFTSKEKTMYYIKVLKEDVELAIDILSDVLQNSVFVESEIEKERGVILQELASCLDTPSDVVFDYFAEGVFGSNGALGRAILGTTNTINAISRQHLVDFLHANYVSGNMVVGLVGNFNTDKGIELVGKYFDKLKVGTSVPSPSCAYVGCGVDVRQKNDLEQLQVVMGFPGYSSDNFEMKYKTSIVANAIGGGMSSMFFQEIREKRGLAYSVGCFADSYKDTGVFGLYVASDVSKLEELMDAVSLCFKESVKDVGDVAIKRTIKQYQAGMLMRQESLSARMGKMLTDFLMYDRYVSHDEVMSYVLGFGALDASLFLKEMMTGSDQKLSVILYGDFRSQEVSQKIKNLSSADLLK